MTEITPNLITDFVDFRNKQKSIFTAGPASLIPENIEGLRPCFGRGDEDYKKIENEVLEKLKKVSGHKKIVRLQGSASLALEIISYNFLYGKILIISSGYYSDRLKILADGAKNMQGEISQIDIMDLNSIDNLTGNYDWIVCCYTETSRGLKLPLKRIKKKAVELNSKIMLDATASIGLETDHDLADVIGYSSCKGLFGLTGAAFIAYNSPPDLKVNSFYLNLETHINKGMTGPYHSICSLFNVLPKLDDFKYCCVPSNLVKYSIEGGTSKTSFLIKAKYMYLAARKSNMNIYLSLIATIYYGLRGLKNRFFNTNRLLNFVYTIRIKLIKKLTSKN